METHRQVSNHRAVVLMQWVLSVLQRGHLADSSCRSTDRISSLPESWEDSASTPGSPSNCVSNRTIGQRYSSCYIRMLIPGEPIVYGNGRFLSVVAAKQPTNKRSRISISVVRSRLSIWFLQLKRQCCKQEREMVKWLTRQLKSQDRQL